MGNNNQDCCHKKSFIPEDFINAVVKVTLKIMQKTDKGTGFLCDSGTITKTYDDTFIMRQVNQQGEVEDVLVLRENIQDIRKKANIVPAQLSDILAGKGKIIE